VAAALQLEDASPVTNGVGHDPAQHHDRGGAMQEAPHRAPISERQNTEHSVQLLRADSRYYLLAKRVHAVRMAGMLVLALLAPVLLFRFSSWADAVAAIAGAWVLAGRTGLSWLEDRWIAKAVTIQEQFDVEVFDIEWNTALAGARAAPEDIHSAARRYSSEKKIERLKNWYPTSVDEAPWPLNVVLCQRSSAVWGRRGHYVYALVVLGLGIAWFLAGIVMAVADHATLAAYLIVVFLPSQPAFLDTIDLFRGHLQQSEAKGAIEIRTTDLWNRGVGDASAVTEQACREVQDQAYTLRRRGVQIPQVMYWLRRKQDEAAMQAAAADLVKALPSAGTTAHVTEPSGP
jgi:hypothetical protein